MQIVYVPYNPYLYNKQVKGSRTTSSPSNPSNPGSSPSGLYTGPQHYEPYEPYRPHYTPYMSSSSAPWQPYHATNTYAVNPASFRPSASNINLHIRDSKRRLQDQQHVCSLLSCNLVSLCRMPTDTIEALA